MRVLVVGAGMYVTGRDGSGTGTVLSSLAETSRTMHISNVTVLGRKSENEAVVKNEALRINSSLCTSLAVEYLPVSGTAERDIPELCSKVRYDCAILSVPDHLHHSFAMALLQEGIPILVVKPLTPTLSEARELIEIQNNKGVYAAVEFHKRWDATNLWVAKSLASDSLGKLQYIGVDYSQKRSIPLTFFRDWSDKTNIFQYLGVHYVDLIYFLTGFRPVKAMGIGTYGLLRDCGISTWDSVHATVLWCNPVNMEESFIAHFATNWIDPLCTSAMSDQKYKVVGTKGRIECDQKNRGLEFVHETAGIQQINPYFSEYLPGEDGDIRFCGYGHQSISRFLMDVLDIKSGKRSVSDLEEIRPTLRQSLVSTAVIDAVNKSMENNSSWQDIDALF